MKNHPKKRGRPFNVQSLTIPEHADVPQNISCKASHAESSPILPRVTKKIKGDESSMIDLSNKKFDLKMDLDQSN